MFLFCSVWLTAKLPSGILYRDHFIRQNSIYIGIEKLRTYKTNGNSNFNGRIYTEKYCAESCLAETDFNCRSFVAGTGNCWWFNDTLATLDLYDAPVTDYGYDLFTRIESCKSVIRV